MILISLQLHRGLHRLVIGIGLRLVAASRGGGAHCGSRRLPRDVRGGPRPVITRGSYVGSVAQELPVIRGGTSATIGSPAG